MQSKQNVNVDTLLLKNDDFATETTKNECLFENKSRIAL